MTITLRAVSCEDYKLYKWQVCVLQAQSSQHDLQAKKRTCAIG